MRPMPVHSRRQRFYEVFLMLVLLAAFAISALVVVMTAADAYRSLAGQAAADAELRIPMIYVAGKIRENDAVGAVELRQIEGVEVLVLSSVEEDATYETRIYPFDGALYEIYCLAGDTLPLSAGQRIVETGGFAIETVDSRPELLQLSASDSEGRTQTLLLSLRSGRSLGEVAQ